MSVIKRHEAFTNFFQILHPLVAGKLSLLRQQQTDHKLFRELVHEITLLLGYEATQNLSTNTVEIQTPMEKCMAPFLAGPSPVILPILRAGVGMVDALLTLMPQAKVGHIGLFRDEKTLKPEGYYFKIPEDSDKRHFYVCDPMLATGGSAIRAVNTLKKHQVKSITFICLLAAPEGLKAFFDEHPDVPIYSASLDRCLNSKGYICPGLGDAGDRMFGTL
ncbi:MAG: uracil phosphoribosyltransferase [Gammaproteobacteria bacterium 39-13]|nr:uracil phosphoribosyltransferase [Gammaproteobacteria bacterium]OJV93828.1 MAG: uracil phosphoribosyltransferase [Gammaproteobacteria bacterium 39-13]